MTNPTAQIDLDFPAFIAKREGDTRKHFDGRVTDYCFSLDQKMRQRLAAIKPLEMAPKAFAQMLIGGLYRAGHRVRLRDSDVMPEVWHRAAAERSLRAGPRIDRLSAADA